MINRLSLKAKDNIETIYTYKPKLKKSINIFF